MLAATHRPFKVGWRAAYDAGSQWLLVDDLFRRRALGTRYSKAGFAPAVSDGRIAAVLAGESSA